MRREVREIEGTGRHAFVEPRSIEEARERYDQLVYDVQTIQLQLSGGNEGPDPEWRLRAKRALTKKQNEMRRMRRWIQEKRSSDWELLARIYSLLGGTQSGDARFASGAKVLVDAEEARSIAAEIRKLVPPSMLGEKR